MESDLKNILERMPPAEQIMECIRILNSARRKAYEMTETIDNLEFDNNALKLRVKELEEELAKRD